MLISIIKHIEIKYVAISDNGTIYKRIPSGNNHLWLVNIGKDAWANVNNEQQVKLEKEFQILNKNKLTKARAGLKYENAVYTRAVVGSD